jgi:hypothetical protein
MQQRRQSPKQSPKKAHRTPGSPRARSVTARDDALLAAVYTYQFLTVEQATRLLYSPGSLVYVRATLRALAARGYLQRLRLPTSGQGNSPHIYTLARKGIRYLEAAGFADFARFRPSEQQEHSYFFLRHTLRVNDVLIAGALLGELAPEILLAEMRHERTLKRTPVYVDVASGGKAERIGVVPDGWMDFHLRGEERMSIVLELDRGTVEERAFKRKLRGLLAYANGPYQTFFGSEAITIAFATTAGELRLRRMRAWCEQTLTDEGGKEHAELLLLTSLPEGELDPRQLFLSPVWQQPFGASPLALLA